MVLWLLRVYFWAALTLLTLLFLAGAAPFILISGALCKIARLDPARSLRHGIWWYGKLFSIMARPVMRLEVQGKDIAYAHEPCIIVPNHQSFMDIYLLSAQLSKNFCIVVTGWPFKKLFFFAALMRRARYIPVTSEEDRLQFMNRCLAELSSGSSIVCFPEGTRSRTGKLQKFHTGIFRVAAQSGVKVVPMLFMDTGRFCPPGTFRVNPGPVHITLLEPLSADKSHEGRKAFFDLAARTRAHMQNALPPGLIQ